MKPPLPYSESAVPRTLHAQLEIAKAMRTLMPPDEDELLRRRRAEIIALRRDLEQFLPELRERKQHLMRRLATQRKQT